MIGERGPEAVIPLSRAGGAATGGVIDYERLGQAVAAALAPLLRELKLEVDGRELGRVVNARLGTRATLLSHGG